MLGDAPLSAYADQVVIVVERLSQRIEIDLAFHTLGKEPSVGRSGELANECALADTLLPFDQQGAFRHQVRNIVDGNHQKGNRTHHRKPEGEFPFSSLEGIFPRVAIQAGECLHLLLVMEGLSHIGHNPPLLIGDGEGLEQQAHAACGVGPRSLMETMPSGIPGDDNQVPVPPFPGENQVFQQGTVVAADDVSLPPFRLQSVGVPLQQMDVGLVVGLQIAAGQCVPLDDGYIGPPQFIRKEPETATDVGDVAAHKRPHRLGDGLPASTLGIRVDKIGDEKFGIGLHLIPSRPKKPKGIPNAPSLPDPTTVSAAKRDMCCGLWLGTRRAVAEGSGPGKGKTAVQLHPFDRQSGGKHPRPCGPPCPTGTGPEYCTAG